jgi:hypothetical protein
MLGPRYHRDGAWHQVDIPDEAIATTRLILQRKPEPKPKKRLGIFPYKESRFNRAYQQAAQEARQARVDAGASKGQPSPT